MRLTKRFLRQLDREMQAAAKAFRDQHLEFLAQSLDPRKRPTNELEVHLMRGRVLAVMALLRLNPPSIDTYLKVSEPFGKLKSLLNLQTLDDEASRGASQ